MPGPGRPAVDTGGNRHTGRRVGYSPVITNSLNQFRELHPSVEESTCSRPSRTADPRLGLHHPGLAAHRPRAGHARRHRRRRRPAHRLAGPADPLGQEGRRPHRRHPGAVQGPGRRGLRAAQAAQVERAGHRPLLHVLGLRHPRPDHRRGLRRAGHQPGLRVPDLRPRPLARLPRGLLRRRRAARPRPTSRSTGCATRPSASSAPAASTARTPGRPGSCSA